MFAIGNPDGALPWQSTTAENDSAAVGSLSGLPRERRSLVPGDVRLATTRINMAQVTLPNYHVAHVSEHVGDTEHIGDGVLEGAVVPHDTSNPPPHRLLSG